MELKQAGRFGVVAMSFTALVALAACSSPSEVTTRDGQTVTTADKPKIDEEKGFVTYEKDGREVQVNKSDVESIREIK